MVNKYLCVLCILCFPAVNEVFAQTVVIPEKTKVKVLIDHSLSTAKNPQSRSVTFKVAEPVSLFDVVVFAAGDPVFAKITEFQNRGHIGKPGKIAVTITSIKAQDGTMIPVRPIRLSHQGESKKTIALPLLLLLGAGYFIKGGDAAIPQGDTVVVATKKRHFFKLE